MDEFKIKPGDIYINGCAKLAVTKNPVKNSVECVCAFCNEVDTYKVSMLKNKEISICKNCQKPLEIGKTYGKTLELLGFRIINNKIGCMMHCIKCDKKYIHSKNDVLRKDYHCLNCGTTKEIEKTKEIKKLQPRSVAKTNKEVTKQKIFGAITDAQNVPTGIDALMQYTIKGDFLIRKDGARISATGQSVTPKYRTLCSKCGAIKIKTERELANSDYRCTECEIRLKDGRNILNNINWVGYTKNNLEIVKTVKNSEGGINCTLKCLICENKVDNKDDAIIDNIPLVSFINEKEFICYRCANTELSVMCPVCGNSHIKITPFKLYCNRDSDTKLLKACGKEIVNREEIVMYHERIARLDNMRKKYTKDYTLAEEIVGRNEFASILKFKQSYIGTDGKEYFSCMCEDHHKLMVLTDEEIRTYRHEYCADTRMMPYNPKIKPR